MSKPDDMLEELRDFLDEEERAEARPGREQGGDDEIFSVAAGAVEAGDLTPATVEILLDALPLPARPSFEDDERARARVRSIAERGLPAPAVSASRMLKEARWANRLSEEDAARILDVTPRTLLAIEFGSVVSLLRLPGAVVAAYARRLQLDPALFLSSLFAQQQVHGALGKGGAPDGHQAIGPYRSPRRELGHERRWVIDFLTALEN